MAKTERQKKHFTIFGFNCECEACVNDYPMAGQLYKTDGEICSNVLSTHDHRFGTPEELLAEFRDNCKLIEKFFKRKPCIEMFMLISRNMFIMTKLKYATPFASIYSKAYPDFLINQ